MLFQSIMKRSSQPPSPCAWAGYYYNASPATRLINGSRHGPRATFNSSGTFQWSRDTLYLQNKNF